MRGQKIIIIALVAMCTAAIAVSFIDPLGPTGRWLPKCPLYSLTGLECPGCGTTRAFHALFTGHPLEAVSYNLFLPVALLMTALSAVSEFSPERFPKLHALLFRPVTLHSFAFLTIFWWIARNIIGI